jgi:(2Fe-2S) ferredoxin
VTAERQDTPDAADDDATQWAFICHASSCRYQGAEAVAVALARALRDSQPATDAAVVRAGCLGLCGAGPAVVTYPGGDVHIRVEQSDAPELAAQLLRGRGLARRSVTVPAWYRQHIVGRLGAYVQLLKRRRSGAPDGPPR